MEIKIKTDYIWLIAYIDSAFIDRISIDLKKHPIYRDIQAYIPTVKILRKQFKGKNEFEKVPLLFNYGFLKIPRHKVNIEFLTSLHKDIPAIYAWVKDPMKALSRKPPIRVVRNSEGEEMELKSELLPEDEINIALATDEQISLMIETQANLTIYSQEEINNLRKGSLITLKGYPFDDMPAKILQINPTTQKVKVELLLEDALSKEVTVSFENVFYTIYQGGFDETRFKEKSLDEIKSKGKNIMDKLELNSQDNGVI